MRVNTRSLLALLLLGTLASCRCNAPAPTAESTAENLAPPPPGWLEGAPTPTPPGAVPVRGGRLVVRAGREPSGLCQLHDRMRDPELARYTVGPLYETLLEVDATGFELRPRLAESWTSSEDGKEHLFRLREGVTFHDGAPFTAADVAATLRAALGSMNVTTAIRASLDGLSSFEVLDPRTILVRWEQPSHAGFRNLALTVPILPAHALAEGFNTAAILHRPIGTGPFRLSSWEAGAALTLERYDGYWRGRALLDAIEIRFVADPAQAWAAFSRGDFDLMTHLSPAQWREMEGAAWARAYQRLKAPGTERSAITWNLRRPLLSDARVRRALAALTPMEEVSAALDRGTSTLADCPFAPGAPDCEPAWKSPFGLEEAARLLDAAGWSTRGTDGVRVRDGARLTLNLLVPSGSSSSASLVQLLARAWAEGGAELKVETLVWEELQARLAQGAFDAVALLWTFEDAAAPLQPLFGSDNPAGLNYGGYANPEADQLFASLRGAFDPNQRQAQRRQLHRVLGEDPPALFLTHPSRLEAAGARVRGLSTGLPWHDLRSLWLEPPEGEVGSGKAASTPATAGGDRGH